MSDSTHGTHGIELKPCPFCGNTQIEILPMEKPPANFEVLGGYKVRCWQCSANVWEFTEYKEQAAAKWNTRKPPEKIATADENKT